MRHHSVETSFGGVYSVETGDLDLDGDLDLTAALSGDQQIIWWINKNGNYQLDYGIDPVLVVDGTIELTSPGATQLAVPHSSKNPAILPNAAEVFFLVAKMTDAATSATPSCFRVVHKAGGTVTQMRYDLYNIDPKPAAFTDVDGGLVCATTGIFSDDFESGNTSAWSTAAP